MSLSTTAQFNPILSEALNKIGENSFVGTRILPVREVGTSNGKYPIFSEGEFDNNSSKERAPGTAFARRDFSYGQQSYDCVQYGLEGVLPDEDRNKANQDGISDVQASIAMKLQRDLMVGHELRVQSLVYGAGFSSNSATAAMSSTSTAKPIKDIQQAVERLSGDGFSDNLALVIEESLYNEMLNTDDLRNIFNGAAVYTNLDVVRSALGVSEIIICPSRYNSAAKGQTASRSKIWPTNKYLVGQIAGGDFSAGGFGRTLAYTPDGGVFSAEEYRDETIKADIQRVYNSVDEVIINTNAAEIITGA